MPPLLALPHILTAEDRYHPHPNQPEPGPAATVVFRWWRHGAGVPAPLRGQMRGPWPTVTHPTARATARVNHGRWVADCPFPECWSAQETSKTDRRFFCIECDSGGSASWIPVVWPDDVDVSIIEAALTGRPDPESRNWWPGIDPATLTAENAQRGLK